MSRGRGRSLQLSATIDHADMRGLVTTGLLSVFAGSCFTLGSSVTSRVGVAHNVVEDSPPDRGSPTSAAAHQLAARYLLISLPAPWR